MQIKTFAQLSKIADICRKKGIETIKITPEAVEFTLKEPIPRKKQLKADGKDNDPGTIETPEQPSEEDMLFWSSAGIPTVGQ